MPLTDPTRLGTILGVWAHPDDEMYLSGGIMAAAADAGRRVVCVTATRGELGPTPDGVGPGELGTLREEELAKCLAVLGVTEHRWLDHPDTGCAAVPLDRAVEPLVALVREVRPDTVLTFGPDGMTGHPDHVAVGRWATEAVRRAGVPGVTTYWATNTPEWIARMATALDPADIMMVEGMQMPETPHDELAIALKLDGDALERKVRAARCQASQVDPLLAVVGEELFREAVSEESFRLPDPV